MGNTSAIAVQAFARTFEHLALIVHMGNTSAIAVQAFLAGFANQKNNKMKFHVVVLCCEPMHGLGGG